MGADDGFDSTVAGGLAADLLQPGCFLSLVLLAASSQKKKKNQRFPPVPSAFVSHTLCGQR